MSDSPIASLYSYKAILSPQSKHHILTAQSNPAQPINQPLQLPHFSFSRPSAMDTNLQPTDANPPATDANLPALGESEHGHNYKFNVSMNCGGCSGAVERVLKKLNGIFLLLSIISQKHVLPHQQNFFAERGFSIGVKSYEVSLNEQTATVQAEPSLDYNTVLETIKKTGKKVKSGEADGVPMVI
jgi:copper chaperone